MRLFDLKSVPIWASHRMVNNMYQFRELEVVYSPHAPGAFDNEFNIAVIDASYCLDRPAIRTLI